MSKEQNKEEQKSSQNVLIGVIILVAIIILLAMVGPKTANDQEIREEEVDGQEEIVDDQRNDENHASNFDYMTLEEWTGLERAQKNIQSLGKGQVIVPGIVADPTDDNIVYFASKAVDEKKKELLRSVYRYQLDNYNFERIYKSTDDRESELGDPNVAFFVAGYDSGRLIIYSNFHTLEPEKCDQLLAYEIGTSQAGDFQSMSIEDPYGDFTGYEISEETLNDVKAKQTSCK